MTAWKIFLIVCTVMFVAISVSAVFPVFAKIMTPAPVAQSIAGTQRQPSLSQPSEAPRRPASQSDSSAYTSAG